MIPLFARFLVDGDKKIVDTLPPPALSPNNVTCVVGVNIQQKGHSIVAVDASSQQTNEKVTTAPHE
jgi:hypothetical protein